MVQKSQTSTWDVKHLVNSRMNYPPQVVNAGLLVAINSIFWYVEVEAIDSESLRKTLFALIFLGGGGSVDSLQIVTGQVAGVSRFSRENGQSTAFLVDAIVFFCILPSNVFYFSITFCRCLQIFRSSLLSQKKAIFLLIPVGTVDGRNPAPVDMVDILLLFIELGKIML